MLNKNQKCLYPIYEESNFIQQEFKNELTSEDEN